MSAPNRRVSAPPRSATRVVNRRPARAVVASATDLIGPHPVELAGLLHELSARLLSADTFGHALERLAAFGANAVPGTLRCSVALIGEGGPITRVASGTAGQAFDELQYALSTGPGLDAARTRALVTSSALTEDQRWPDLTDAARTDGICSVVAIPLDVERAEVGALSLYLDHPGALGPDLLLTAMALVSQAEVLLGALRRREALAEGAVVDRAVGVIIAQRGCGVQEAYDILRDTAQRLGLPRQAVAERLIAVVARNA